MTVGGIHLKICMLCRTEIWRDELRLSNNTGFDRYARVLCVCTSYCEKQSRNKCGPES